jgi:hypothetical protein
MTKKVSARPKSAVDRLAEWLARQPRLVRSILAGLVAMAITLALALAVYGFLISLPMGSLSIGSTSMSDIVTIALSALVVFGVVLYWVGWRVLVGFDMGETPLKPGRPAALWVLIGIIAFVITLIVVSIYTVTVIAPG